MTKIQHKIITLQEAMREAKGRGCAIEELQARYFESVTEAETEYGPDVPSMILHLIPRKGRPKIGEIVELVQVKSVKIPKSCSNLFRKRLGKQNKLCGRYFGRG